MENILKIYEKLNSVNKKLYIVGGFCRNKILGLENNGDIDLVTDANPEEMQKVLKIVGEVGKKYGTCIVSENKETFEITTFRKDIGSVNFRKPAEVIFTKFLEEDAKRRDFTCNAIYFDPKTEEFFDPENGIKDLKNNILRFVGNPEERIGEDILRILRFIRFKNKYNFSVAENNYFELFKENISHLQNLPIERILGELEQILLHESNISALDDLKEICFLKIFLPEIDKLSEIPGNKHHLEGNVWIHTKMCISEMNKNIYREKIISKDKKLILIFAMLFHDMGKAPTWEIDENGESHYFLHEGVGAEMFLKIAKRFKFSNDFTKEIHFLIAEHMRVFNIPNMKNLKARKLMMNPFFEDLMLVGEADTKGRIPAKTERLFQIHEVYKNFKIWISGKTFFTGEDIMKRYPELKGREIGEKLKNLNDQILAND